MNYQIKPFQQGDEQAVYSLVKTVYDEFVQHENTAEGNQLFYDWIAPEKIASRQKPQNNCWLAVADSKIVGVIEIRDNKNITLLFVDKHYQGRGIARQLFQKVLQECLKRDTARNKFFVHSSLGAVPVYKGLGFRVVSKAKKENGIYYVPMEIQLKQTLNNNLK